MLSLFILRLEITEVNNKKHLIALPHWRVSQIPGVIGDFIFYSEPVIKVEVQCKTCNKNAFQNTH